MESRQEVHQRALAGSARPHQSDHLAALRMQLNLLQHAAGVVVIGETHILEYDLVRKGRKRFCAGLFADFLLPIQVGEHLRAHTQHSLELLIDIAGSLDGHVGTEHGIQEGEELAFGHELVADLIARIEKQKRDGDGAQEIHQRSGDDRSADPAHVFAKQAASRFPELGDFEGFHSESFDDAIAGDCFLKDLAEFAEAGLAVFGGATNLAAEFIDRKDDHGEEHDRAQGHSPVQRKNDHDEDEEGETFAEEIGEMLGERDARALDIVDGHGEKPAGGMVLEETDGLADQLGVNGVAQIGDRGVADVLNLRGSQIFGHGFNAEDHQESEKENCLYVVEAGGEKGIEVNDVIGEGDFAERKF